MRQLNSRKEWVEFFDNEQSNYFLVRWVGLHDGKEHEEPVRFSKILSKDGSHYQELVPLKNEKTNELECLLPYNPLPEKIIIVKSLSEDDVLKLF